jgi:1-deoxy-D-xylulose-5-phosphate synthase
MTAGMAFEALNNAGVSDTNVLVILNDNDMSISPPVGALNRYLAQLMSGRFYSAAKEVGKQVLKMHRHCLIWLDAFEQQAKGMVVPATLFEKFGFNYIGPIDGHDLDSLIPTLENIKHLQGAPVFACGHSQRPRLQTRRSGPHCLPWTGQIRPQGGLGAAGYCAQTNFQPSVWHMVMRHGGSRPQVGGHHTGHARGLGHGGVSPPFS